MKKILAQSVFLFFFVACLSGVATAAPWTLRGSNADVVIPDQPTESEETAAADLVKHLSQVTGGKFKIVREKSAGGKFGFFIGNTKRAAKEKIDVKALGDEAIHLKSTRNGLVLAGGKRGCLYAVSVFLENYVGVKWFAPDCTVLPSTKTIKLPDINYTYAPPFEMRSMDGYSVRSDSNVRKDEREINREFALHLRLNGAYNGQSAKYGGYFQIGRGQDVSDSFFYHVPPKVYFKEHPEYYSEVSGERRAIQLCLANEALVDVVVASLEKDIKEKPHVDIFSFAQNDGNFGCGCKKCTKIAQEEGGQSGCMIRFMNKIAEKLAPKYPNKYILTDAYLWTQKPPKKVKAHKNVVVCVTTYGARSWTPYTASKSKRFITELQNWKSVCDNILIYDYNARFDNYMVLHANWFIQGPNIRVFRDVGVRWIYQQAAPYACAEFKEFRAYITGKLYWNPDLDQTVLMKEFCDAFYGAAGPYVQKYMDIMYSDIVGNKGHIRVETGRRAIDELKKGMKLVENDEVRTKRMKCAMISALAWLLRQEKKNNKGALVEKDDRVVSEGLTLSSDYEENLKNLTDWSKEFKYGWIGENGPEATMRGYLDRLPRPRDMKIEHLQNDLLDVQILPGYGGRIYRIVHKPSGADLITSGRTKRNGKILVNPETGGCTINIQKGGGGCGKVDDYSVSERKDNSVTVECLVNDGATKLKRTYSLDAKANRLDITTEVIKNHKSNKAFWPYIITEMYLNKRAGAIKSLYLAQENGKWKRVNLAGVRNGVGATLSGEACPQNAWAVEIEVPAAREPIVLRHTFNRENLRWARWMSHQSSVLFELESGKKRCGNYGDSYVFKESYEVTTLKNLTSKKK